MVLASATPPQTSLREVVNAIFLFRGHVCVRDVLPTATVAEIRKPLGHPHPLRLIQPLSSNAQTLQVTRGINL